MYKKLYYIHNKSTNPFYNLALEEYILTTKKNMSFLVLWQNNNTVVIGNNQNAMEEINLDFVRKNGISVVRRTTGGGAVYHDMGNVNFSFITELDESEGFTINDFTRPVIKALSDIGVTAKADGRNDITIDGLKISGNAQRIYKGRILHHGTLLFDPDKEMLVSALRPRPEKYESKSTKSVKSRVGSIASFLKSSMTVDEFILSLKNSFSKDVPIEDYVFTAEDEAAVKKLAEEKYARPDWTFRAVQPMDIKCSAKFDGGIIDIMLNVKESRIDGCRIFGDFMAAADIAPLEESLIGAEFSPEGVYGAIKDLPLKNILGDITSKELVSCIFD